MNKLSKKEIDERDKLLDALDTAQQDLEGEVNAFNEKVAALWDELIEPALAKAKEATEAFNSFREGVAGDMRNYYDEKSEKWQEGDAGQAYERWMDDWEEELEEPELHDECPQISEFDYDPANSLTDKYSVEKDEG